MEVYYKELKSDQSSRKEAEYFSHRKIPSYFSRIGEETQEDFLSSILSHNHNHGPQSNSLRSAGMKSLVPGIKVKSGSSPDPWDSDVNSAAVTDTAAGGSASILESTVMNRVASFKSILSVSNLVSANSNPVGGSSASKAAVNAPLTPDVNASKNEYGHNIRDGTNLVGGVKTPSNMQTVDRIKGTTVVKSPVNVSSKRPKTTYITNGETLSTEAWNKYTDHFHVLSDLTLDPVDLNVSSDIDNDGGGREEVSPSWRLKERMKTVGVGLILALNIGTDPPDVIKPNPCAKLQCWMDPSSTSRSKAREKIGELLEAQYARWQGQNRFSKIKYKRALDPTVEDVRNLCNSLRRAAKNERVLLHYNGHGVPRPTQNGEIWVFDKNHTQYIPFSVTDLKYLIGTPTLVILDCSGAGALLPFLVANEPNGIPITTTSFEKDGGIQGHGSVKNVIVLCPTAKSEVLPMNPDLPADLFTSCLTTPIAIALRWFIRQNPLSCGKIDPDSVDLIPGKLNDRKTLLGELNWIFTAITDTIVWNILPTSLFQSLFRQDLMVASMFRNFLLADRILRELKCTPTSYPRLPSTCNHPLWQAWDLAVETCISQLVKEGILGSKVQPTSRVLGSADDDNDDEDDSHEDDRYSAKQSSNRYFDKHQYSSDMKTKETSEGEGASNSYNISAPFFAEQLTAFEKWLEYAASRVRSGGTILPPPMKQNESFTGMQKLASYMYPGMSRNVESPEQLPVVLQVLLSPAHRERALVLLRKFLYLGPSAVNLALSVGICPYVLRLLQSPIDEYKHLLVGIWSKILEFDPGCKNDLVKDGALPHFIRHLDWDNVPSQIQKKSSGSSSGFKKEDSRWHQRTMAAVILSVICSDDPLGPNEPHFTLGQTECIRRNLHGTCVSILKRTDSEGNPENPPEFRMWLCICLGILCKDNITAQNEAFKQDVHLQLFSLIHDICPDVRAAACYALGCLVSLADTSSNFVGIIPNPDVSSVLLSPMNKAPIQNVTTGLPWQQQGGAPLQTQSGLVQPPTIMSFTPNGTTQEGFLAPLPSQNPITFQTAVDAGNKSYTTDRDMKFFKEILCASCDASPIVRYEATVVLGRLIRKNLDLFVSIAKTFRDDTDRTINEESTGGLTEQRLCDKGLLAVWKNVRSMHESDPHPKVASANTSILRMVNERILLEDARLQPGSFQNGNVDGTEFEHNANTSQTYQRAQSANNLAMDSRKEKSGLKQIRAPSLVSIAENSKISNLTFTSRNAKSGLEITDQPSEPFLFAKDPFSPGKDVKQNVECTDLPVSEFFEWQKEMFQNESNRCSEEILLDPLYERDAIILHREQRNSQVDRRTQLLSEKYALLRPVPKKKRSVLDVDSEELDEEEVAIEAELATKKKSLELKKNTIISYHGTKMTHMLRFHSYGSILAASDGANNVSVWDIKHPETKIRSLSNGNEGTTKMTAMSWMNERNHSLLMTGCDDGSIRIWDNIVDCKFDTDETEPQLITAFYALPELNPCQRPSRGSGLVIEWQQSKGRLIAGGNTNVIRCWDLESEKCSIKIDSRISTSCVTSFATAWDYVQNDKNTGAFSGLGPDIILGGYGDGQITVFDLRMHERQREATTMGESPQIARRNRNRLYKEHVHKNWIVNLSYSYSPNKYEIVSGAVSGDLKFWDLRVPRPIRSLDIQRSAMTALACHPRIPMLASGSDANFIKVCSVDGDTLQAFRHHEQLQGKRIGRVSTLAFHPNAPILAAGFTDDIIGVYSA